MIDYGCPEAFVFQKIQGLRAAAVTADIEPVYLQDHLYRVRKQFIIIC
jgi:hypothetical protein